jgi:hypothetical protein
VVFWFWFGLAVLIVPPVAYGLMLAAVYLYLGRYHAGLLVRLLSKWKN